MSTSDIGSALSAVSGCEGVLCVSHDVLLGSLKYGPSGSAELLEFCPVLENHHSLGHLTDFSFLVFL